MSQAPKIQCPQPSRPLKRKNLEALNSLRGEPAPKQACGSSLLELGPPSANAGSESLSARCPLDSHPTRDQWDLREAAAPHTTAVLPWTNSDRQSMTPPAGSLESASTPSRVRSPGYRHELFTYGIKIDPCGERLPDHIKNHASDIFRHPRHSPGLSDEQARQAMLQLSGMHSADEHDFYGGFGRTDLLPNGYDYGGRIATGSNLLFNRASLPDVPNSAFGPVVTPKPDYHYTYNYPVFDRSEAIGMSHSCLQPISAPTTAGFWPFFLVEFKSPSRGGTSWVAENQNAVGGAQIVHAMRTLRHHARGDRPAEGDSHQVAFSGIVDVNNASLWVHWCNAEDEAEVEWLSAEVAHYHFKKVDEIRDFRAAARNIIDYALGERLDWIKATLRDVYDSNLDTDNQG